MNLTVSVFFL
uniref:Uncharacterized protein n=1 Tax=Rhizophora mucronata TaxID=61149 RepID=A0A2P2PY28_RHIMU